FITVFTQTANRETPVTRHIPAFRQGFLQVTVRPKQVTIQEYGTCRINIINRKGNRFCKTHIVLARPAPDDLVPGTPMIIRPVILPVIRQTYALPARARHLSRTLSPTLLNLVNLHLPMLTTTTVAFRLTDTTEQAKPAK